MKSHLQRVARAEFNLSSAECSSDDHSALQLNRFGVFVGMEESHISVPLFHSYLKVCCIDCLGRHSRNGIHPCIDYGIVLMQKGISSERAVERPVRL